MRTLLIFFYILFLSGIVTAQQISVDELREKYVNFEYEEVINFAERMLQNEIYSRSELVQIYEMKGISHYSLGEEQKAREAFWNLLEQNINHTMDPQQISPKIISFFNDVKVEFQNQVEEEKPILDSLNTIRQQFISSHTNYKNAIVKNLIVPGWGQFQLGNNAKGFVYGLLGLSSTAASIYYIAETNNKRSDYLNETNKDLIETKYQAYNSAYKNRNLFLTIAGIVWLTSQIDIIFFSEDNRIPQVSTSFQPGVRSDINLNFSFPLN